MKTSIVIFTMIVTLLLWKNAANGQITTSSNTQNSTSDYVGWDNGTTTTIPVRFEHNANIGSLSRFEWHTNISGTVAERMRLTQAGWLGIGTQVPVHDVHIHEPLTGVSTNTGIAITTADILPIGQNGGTNGLHIHVGPGTTPDADITWYEDTPFVLRQHGEERISLTSNSSNESRIGFAYFSSFAPLEPSAHFHLGRGLTNMERTWMNEGIFIGSPDNLDLMYLGIQENANLQSDAIVGWGCQTPGFSGGHDNLRFIFLAPTADFGSGPETTDEGLEAARVSPLGNWGLGNFASTGLNVQPTERLDVDGNARFRDVPTNENDVLITGTENATGDYTLSRIAFGTDDSQYLANDGTWQAVPTPTCDWDLVNTDDIATGFSGACKEGRVGIGTDTPSSKLTIENTLTSSGHTVAVTSSSSGDIVHRGMYVRAGGGTDAVAGIEGHAQATADGDSGDPTEAMGVRGIAAHTTYCDVHSYGVYGQATGGTICGGSVTAGYFAGTVTTSGSIINLSDQAVKTGVEEAPNALEFLSNLHPVSYNYDLETYPDMGLEGGLHYGFIAQEIQAVSPELTKAIHHPGTYSEEGEYLGGSMDLLGINYIEIIPLLVKAIQEQQAMIDACCSDAKSLQQNGPDHHMDLKLENKAAPMLFQNMPNPHQGQCIIKYFLPADQASYELQFFDQFGNLIRIVELNEKGLGQINLDASSLASGIYSYALMSDGKVLDVKKMVKTK